MDRDVALLKAALAEHLAWHGARLSFLAQFLLALFKVRSVNLAELAQGFSGPAHVASHYKRLQRFFRAFTLDYEVLARLLVQLFPIGEGPWYLTLDRTNWKFGKTDLNFLILGIAHHGMALPILWTVLDKAGNSDTEERIALMQRFLKLFGATSIKALLADREFVGEDWWHWLQRENVPFYLRLKRNTLIPNAWNVPMRVDRLFQSLKPGQTRYLEGRRPVWGCFVHLSVLRMDEGEWLALASSGAPQTEAFSAYSRRWDIETLFGALKSRGFNFEETHLTHPERIGKLLGLLALAFAWTYRTGETLAAQQPIPFKKPCSAPSNRSSATASISSAIFS
jgi:hypothetical protein